MRLIRRASAVGGAISGALLAWHHVGYPAALWLLHRREDRGADPAATAGVPLPRVAFVIAAHDEEAVIGAKVANARALDYPAELLRIVVACDGCTDATAERAREAGADTVLELERGGKMAAQHVAMEAVEESVVAWSDANSRWEPGALRALVGALARGADASGDCPATGGPWWTADPQRSLPITERPVGYACGRVTFHRGDEPGADNQEGAYWRYEMAIRGWESGLASVTAGNGAIYAIRSRAYDAYAFDPRMGHDLAMPFQLVRAGWRAVDVPAARATEKMVPTLNGELRRKRRMMRHVWTTVLRGGMLDLSGQPPRYRWMLISHRFLRYAGPLLHLLVLLAALTGARRSPRAALLLAAHAAGAGASAAPDRLPAGAPRAVGRLGRYYLGTQLAIALGLADHLRHGTQGAWQPPEGTR